MSENRDLRNLDGGPDLATAGREETGIWKEKESTATPARAADERSGAPFPTQGDAPSADDPFAAGSPEVSGGVDAAPMTPRERQAVEMQKNDPDGPSYEAHQDPEDRSTGGSIDPNNARSFSDSGNETQR
ncbi:MAG TPA: hypothetical protein VGE01_07230 [Fimbriimonas sp.]